MWWVRQCADCQKSRKDSTQITLALYISCVVGFTLVLLFTTNKMLRNRLLQYSRQRTQLLQRVNGTRSITVVRKVGTTAACVALPQQKAKHSLTLWKFTSLAAATALTYELTKTKVLALEAGDCE